MSTREVPLMKEFLGSYRNSVVRLFRRQIFDKTVQDLHTGRVFQVKAGIVGQADVYGFIKKEPIAIPFEIEFKAASTRMSAEQEAWEAFCTVWFIPHLTLRAGKDEKEAVTLKRWSSEVDALVSWLLSTKPVH